MSAEFIKTPLGKQIYDLLPEVYRTRDTVSPDSTGDLARFLDACGHILTLLRQTLNQRLADSFPDNPADQDLACQPWLLPYFADLVDVRLVSPDEAGRRDEVSQAVAWRQRKGTLRVLEQIAERVGRFEVEVQEGWKQVATTPRLGLPLLPARALGESDLFDDSDYRQHPAWAARHPGLPAVTVDLRYPSRALQVEPQDGAPPQNPAAKQTNFAGTRLWWRQVNPHGGPCFPGSYEDISRRTVDLRTPDWRQGHSHPKRVLLYAPPPLGFFTPGQFEILGDVEFTEDKEHLLENKIVDGLLGLKAGSLRLQKCAVRRLEITAALPVAEPVLVAQNTLFGQAEIGGLARLEYCSVLEAFQADRLQASDCIFYGSLNLTPATQTAPHCLRFSRIPPGLAVANLLAYQNTTDIPIGYEFEFAVDGVLERRQASFGEPGCAVLHPATSEKIRFGAEDGGEMGVHHDWRYSLLLAAVQTKLQDFLPLGIEAVIIPDLRLLALPYPPCDH
ncbi:MAG: phage tail protein [Thermodesulfobacteriota bacterium]